MSEFLKIPLLFCPYFLINLSLDNYFNKKNSRNMVAGLHAVSSVILNGCYLFSNNDATASNAEMLGL